jgi:PAS domain S-box-containing protein
VKNLELSALDLLDSVSDAIVTFNHSGEIEYINKSFNNLQYYFGIDRLTNTLNTNIFDAKLFLQFNIANQLKDILLGISFEKHFNFLEIKNENQIVIVIKGLPIFDGNEIDGGILLIEYPKALSNILEKNEVVSDLYKDSTLNNRVLMHLENKTNQLQISPKENLYTSIVDYANDGIALVNDSFIVAANLSFCKLFGYSCEEDLINKKINDFIITENKFNEEEFFISLESKKQNNSPFYFLIKKQDGCNVDVELSVNSFDSEDKHFNIIIARNVTENIKERKKILQAEEHYKIISESIDDFLFNFEAVGTSLKPVFCTNSIQKISGYTQAEFLSDSKLFLRAVHPVDFAAVKLKLNAILRSRFHKTGEFEFRILTKQANVVWIRVKINLIRSSVGRIKTIFGIVSDISLRKKAEQELLSSTQNLMKLNETKDRFISIISHDLRSPFTSILGFADILLGNEDLSEEERKQFITYIQDSAHSTLSLLTSLLNLTRLQTGRTKIEPQKINVETIITESIVSFLDLAAKKNIEVVSLITKPIYLFADKNLVVQVFEHLISNAIKFTNSGGYINILFEPVANSRFAQFIVKDNGTGIREEDIAKLFSVDAKFTSDGTAGEKGTGFGLCIVKEIIEKHGGTFSVKSELGKGTEFIFTLPFTPSNILIVDDNKTDRLLYAKILKSIFPDYNLEAASNGKEALEKICNAPPAIIITEHSMPVMDGYQFAVELKNIEMVNKPPIIILSRIIDRAEINDYKQLGIEFIFKKPVNINTFKLALEKTLHKKL